MHERKENIFLPIGFFLLTVITRLPFTSRYLYHMDSVQFALALEKYDITVHQPHPPGYFLYVMLGRFVNLFFSDANSTFIFISIVFSGLTIIGIYYLGRDIFDQKTGIFAALIALTSPNMWFHGEVALSYTVEAFFSTLVALLCWRILKGEHKYIWLSVIMLGIAGGVRQNTIIFLMPLWLFSVKGIPFKKIVLSIGLLGVICLLWFIPMIWMAGGWNTYNEAFRELWLFNTGNLSVFEKGWTSFKIFSNLLFRFVTYGIGAGIFVICLAAYSLIRHKDLKSLRRETVIFFSSWILPSVLLFVLIFIHPTNPGYVLIFLPAVFLLAAVAIEYVSNDLERFLERDISRLLVTAVIFLNATLFFFSENISYKGISRHDRDLPVMLKSIKIYDPSDTAIAVGPYSYLGYRHIMYYLPRYRVYQIDLRTADTGETRKIFWGVNRQSFVTKAIILPENIDKFIMIFIPGDTNMDKAKKMTSIQKLSTTSIYLAVGKLSLLTDIYPTLRVFHER